LKCKEETEVKQDMTNQEREEKIKLLCSTFVGSVKRLGYPVGMGIGPSENDMATCARKLNEIIDKAYSAGFITGQSEEMK
jgi:hypothetical protein